MPKNVGLKEFVEIFIQLHYMEQLGKGVTTIISKYDTSVYHFGSSFIQCVLPYNVLSKTKNVIDTENDIENKKENTERYACYIKLK